MKYRAYLLKRSIEDVFIYPFVLLGRLMGAPATRSRCYRIYFFFPFYHTGGAEKVHAQIVKATGGADCIIFFTRRSRDQRFLEEFKSAGCEISDISAYTDNKWMYFNNLIWRGRISKLINQQKAPAVVFNGQCNFAYKISPWIQRDIPQTELIHSFNSFSWIRIPFLPFIRQTIMISQQRIAEHRRQYQALGVPSALADNIRFVQNAIELPAQECAAKPAALKVLFVGRGSAEKRPELFIAMARLLPGIHFTLAGDMPASITADLPENVHCTGNIDDPAQLHSIYCQHHVLIIPSSTEGFPIVLMEAMARGCAVLATPVGDIPAHISSATGFVFSSVDEKTVVSEACNWLKAVTPLDLENYRQHTIAYARQNFDIAQFNQQYQTILQP